MSEVHVFINWLLGHKEILTLLAVIAAGIGALYRPVRDLLKALPRFLWALVKFTFQFIWFVIWPLRKLIVWAYGKFLSSRVDDHFEKISNYLDKKEAAKEKLRDKNRPIETIEL